MIHPSVVIISTRLSEVVDSRLARCNYIYVPVMSCKSQSLRYKLHFLRPFFFPSESTWQIAVSINATFLVPNVRSVKRYLKYCWTEDNIKNFVMILYHTFVTAIILKGIIFFFSFFYEINMHIPALPSQLPSVFTDFKTT